MSSNLENLLITLIFIAAVAAGFALLGWLADKIERTSKCSKK